MIGYKLTRADGSSLSDAYGRVVYPLDDGSLVEVPGRGAYVAHSVPGLLRGGFGPRLVEVEYDEADCLGGDAEIAEVRRLRVLRATTIDAWTLVRVAIRAARDAQSPDPDPHAIAAIEAAERCERERTPEAAAAAWAAAETAWAAAAEVVGTATLAVIWAAKAAFGATLAAEAVAILTAEAAQAAPRARILGYLVEDAFSSAARAPR